MDIPIMVEISARHVHLSREHADILFGKDYEFTIKRELYHPNSYIVEERVDIATENGGMKSLALLTPLRGFSQVEVSATDARAMKTSAPVRLSGDIAGSAPVTLIGPKGSVKLDEGLIVAKRHIHTNPETAQKYGLKADQVVSVNLRGSRPAILEDVELRISEEFKTSMHIDTDEANACGVANGDTGYIIL